MGRRDISAEYGFSPNYGIVKGLIRVFLGWPVIIDTAILPWLADLPLIGACSSCAAAYQIITKAHAGVVPWARNPIIFIGFFVLLIGVLRAAIQHDQILVLHLSVGAGVGSVVGHRSGSSTAEVDGDETNGSGVPRRVRLLCRCSSRVLISSSSYHTGREPSVRYRLGEFERYQEIWYLRLGLRIARPIHQ